MKRQKINAVTISFAAMMAAIVYVVTLFRFPLLDSKVHFANAMCLLSGMLLGPLTGGVAAGLGSALYDALAGGYDLINVLITFVSKFAMAFVCGIIMQRSGERKGRADRTLIASIAGALTYVCLYMIKTFIFKHYVSGYPMASMGVVMIEKLIPSLLNAAVAIVAAPLFYHAVLPALRGSGLLKHMQPD